MMEIFTYTFTVDAPLNSVAAFHADTRVLKKLNPPLIFVQLHRVDPMADGSISEFTLWMGPFPIRWRAVHSNVGSQGFTDTQEKGPLASWKHTHRFESIDENTTQIHEQIVYEYPSGWRGLLTRTLFGRLGLTFLFAYRKWATRRGLSRSEQKIQTKMEK
jgi:ligand-binding SRPBCC domain-containing protein